MGKTLTKVHCFLGCCRYNSDDLECLKEEVLLEVIADSGVLICKNFKPKGD